MGAGSVLVPSFLGSFASDAVANNHLNNQGWSPADGQPRSTARVDGLMYWNTTTSTMMCLLSGVWTAVGGGGGGALETAIQHAPVIAHVDPTVNALVTFVDPTGLIDDGWQIEIYKYSAHRPGIHGDNDQLIRLGKRFRPDRMLAVGATSWTVPVALQLQRFRSHFRFAYRWPEAPGVAGPGTRGPVGQFTVSTSRSSDRSYAGTYLFLQTPW